MSDIVFLSVDNVLFIHNEILKNTVEDINLSPDMSLDSAINRITDYVYYENLNDIYEIAALYAIAIAKGHCFNNGNKRTALVSMFVFLSVNGIELTANNIEIENKIVSIVENNIERSELAEWLKSYCKPILLELFTD